MFWGGDKAYGPVIDIMVKVFSAGRCIVGVVSTATQGVWFWREMVREHGGKW